MLAHTHIHVYGLGVYGYIWLKVPSQTCSVRNSAKGRQYYFPPSRFIYTTAQSIYTVHWRRFTFMSPITVPGGNSELFRILDVFSYLYICMYCIIHIIYTCIVNRHLMLRKHKHLYTYICVFVRKLKIYTLRVYSSLCIIY